LSDRRQRGEPYGTREGGGEAAGTGPGAGDVAVTDPRAARCSGGRPRLEGTGALRTSTADPRRRDAPAAQGESASTSSGRIRGSPLGRSRDPSDTGSLRGPLGGRSSPAARQLPARVPARVG